MNNIPNVTFILGTRPEAIKLAPIIIAFKCCKKIETRIILTGQHDEMVDIVMKSFDLVEDHNLRLMTQNQTLSEITCKTLEGLKKEFEKKKPQLVLVQGDTTTAFASSLAAFYEKIPLAHVEAGLRTNNLLDPYPEEANRRLISQIASLNFAPTNHALENLKVSNVNGKIIVTGNSVIDALRIISDKLIEPKIPNINWKTKKIIIATIHRRENWGSRLESILKGLLMILEKFEDVSILIPLHKNKIVRDPIIRNLSKHPRAVLVEHMEYTVFISSLKRCTFLLTDSGGLQEEAPAFYKPVLVLRETTERSEAIDAGLAKLVGCESTNIFSEASALLQDSQIYQRMSTGKNPFGDGKASVRILEECLNFLNL